MPGIVWKFALAVKIRGNGLIFEFWRYGLEAGNIGCAHLIFRQCWQRRKGRSSMKPRLSAIQDNLCRARMERLALIRQRAESTLKDNVLPFWTRNTWDQEYGGFLTRLDRRGELLDKSEKVLMMQARMIISLSAAHSQLPCAATSSGRRNTRCAIPFSSRSARCDFPSTASTCSTKRRA